MKKRSRHPVRYRTDLERFEDRLLLATFVVTDPGDNGNNASPIPHSLRDAIEMSNATAGPNQIDFAIAGSLPKIVLASALPALTTPVTIDGSVTVKGQTQPGVQLVGDNAGSTSPGLVITGGQSTVKGLSITGFGGDGIVLSGKGNDLVEVDYLGVDLSGSVVSANADGVKIDGSSGNTLMTDLLSGNRGRGRPDHERCHHQHGPGLLHRHRRQRHDFAR